MKIVFQRELLRIPTELSTGQEGEEKSISKAILECITTTKMVMSQRKFPGGLWSVRSYWVTKEKELKILDSTVMQWLPKRVVIFFFFKEMPSHWLSHSDQEMTEVTWRQREENSGQPPKVPGNLASSSASIKLQSNSCHSSADLSMSVALTIHF